MTTFTIDSPIFQDLKGTVGINSAQLDKLIAAANSNPVLNNLLARAMAENASVANGNKLVVDL